MTERIDGRSWQQLQVHEGGIAEFANEADGFWLRSDFGTLRAFDPTISDDECLSVRQFRTHADRRRVACEEGLCHLGPGVAVYCVDVGSEKRGNFGFWRRKFSDQDFSGVGLEKLVAKLGKDIGAGIGVTLGFECPQTIPVPDKVVELGRARPGERNRAWCAGAGPVVLAHGLQQLAWILRSLDERSTRRPAITFSWPKFAEGAANLHLWEAFVTGPGRGDDLGRHVADARAGAEELIWRAAQLPPNKDLASDVYTGGGLNLAAAAAVWAGLGEPVLLSEPVTVIMADRPIVRTTGDHAPDRS